MIGVLLGAGRRGPPPLLAGVEFGQAVLRKASQSNYRESRNLAKQVRKECVCWEVGGTTGCESTAGAKKTKGVPRVR